MFDALKILKPAWYFNHSKVQDIWTDMSNVSPENGQYLLPDDRFISTSGKLTDQAYRLLQLHVPSDAPKPLKVNSISVRDEYTFIAKYFNKIWLPYYYLNRICRLKNPIIESIACIRALSIKRFEWSKVHKEVDSLPESRIADTPLVAVIIPTLNRFEHLENALADLYVQDYNNFEIIVVDQSDQVPASFLEHHKQKIIYIHQKERALWKARNEAVESTKAEYLLFFDDDSRVESTWISSHMRAIVNYQADISSGISLSKKGDNIPENYQYFRLSDQLDTGNVMIKRDVFRKTGLFDRQFEKQRMGDGEFGLRAMLAGFKNVSNPRAQRIHLKVPSGGLRQHGHWDGWRSKKLLSPKPVPSVLYYCRRYWGNKVARRFVMVNIAPSIIPYGVKSRKWLLIFFVPFLPLILVVLTIQVWRSWHLSSKMLKQGPLIKHLSEN